MSTPDRRAALLRQAIGRSGPVTPTQGDWQQWVWSARMDRVVPLLYRLIEEVPTDLDDDQRAELRQLFGAVMCRCVQLEHHLIVVTQLLAEGGIGAVALKGGATAHLDYPDPSWREFSDIDLLIDPADRVKATALVEAVGWNQGYALPAGHDCYTHAVTFIHERMELDLHQRIAHRALGLLLPTRELIGLATPFQVAGAELLALDTVDRIIHATVHAVASGRSSQRLSGLADILVLAENSPDLAEAVLERAERRSVRALVERGLRDAYAVAQLDVNAGWVEAMNHPIRIRDRLVDRAYLDSRRHPLLEELAYLRRFDDWRDRLEYVAGYFIIERAGLRERVGYLWSKIRSTS